MIRLIAYAEEMRRAKAEADGAAVAHPSEPARGNKRRSAARKTHPDMRGRRQLNRQVKVQADPVTAAPTQVVVHAKEAKAPVTEGGEWAEARIKTAGEEAAMVLVVLNASGRLFKLPLAR
jgi:hypothetical protein